MAFKFKKSGSGVCLNPRLSKGTILILALTIGLLAYFPPREIGAASDYPSGPIKIIVPWAPGGPADTLWRALGAVAEKQIGQRILIENKPGGSGSIGTLLIKNAPPDGYTLGHASTSAFVQNPIMENISYDTQKDFTYILEIAFINYSLACRADLPFKSFKEFIEYSRSHPGEVRVGFYGPTGMATLATKYIAHKEGLKWRDVTFKGSGPGIVAILGEHIDVWAGAGEQYPYIKSGKLRNLITMTPEPNPEFPNLPLFDKFYPEMKGTYSAFSLIGPKSIPEPIVLKLENIFIEAAKDPKIVKVLDNLGASLVIRRHEEFQKDITKLNEVSKRLVQILDTNKEKK